MPADSERRKEGVLDLPIERLSAATFGYQTSGRRAIESERHQRET
jgi:hypothetical protein